MCWADYTFYAVTDEPKIHGVTESEEAKIPIGGRGNQRERLSGDPYADNMEAGSDLQGNTGIL